MSSVAIFLFLLSIIVAAWIAFDAAERGLSPLYWGLMAILFWLPTLIHYLVCRRKLEDATR